MRPASRRLYVPNTAALPVAAALDTPAAVDDIPGAVVEARFEFALLAVEVAVAGFGQAAGAGRSLPLPLSSLFVPLSHPGNCKERRFPVSHRRMGRNY
jgi:hypothetical protein